MYSRSAVNLLRRESAGWGQAPELEVGVGAQRNRARPRASGLTRVRSTWDFSCKFGLRVPLDVKNLQVGFVLQFEYSEFENSGLRGPLNVGNRS